MRYIIFLALLAVMVWSFERNPKNTIRVLSVSKFPLFSDDIFYTIFTPRKSDFPIFSLMLFIIRDGSNVLAKGNFYPGYTSTLDYPSGQYFEYIKAKVSINRTISVRLKFSEKANLYLFEIRYGEYASKEKMDFAKSHYLLYMDVKYSRQVRLNVRTKLDVKTMTLDGRTDGVTVNEPGYFFCKGTGGVPPLRVRLDSLEEFELLDDAEEYDPIKNTVRRKARFTMENHEDWFQCYTENSVREAQVMVFHHPTKVYLEPRYYSTMPNGSSVSCVAEDGYPTPEIRWSLQFGPPNADSYYNSFKHELFMLGNAPIGSQWSFMCIAENIIPYTRRNFTTYLFEFTIVNSNSNVLVMAAATVGTLVALVAILVVIFLIVRPGRAKSIAAKRRRGANNSTSNTANCKELGYDADTAMVPVVKGGGSSPQCMTVASAGVGSEGMNSAAPPYEDLEVASSTGGGAIITNKTPVPQQNNRNGGPATKFDTAAKDPNGASYV